MNAIHHAYESGKLAAAATFAPVAAPTPKGPTPQPTQTASTPATNQSKPAVKAPAALGMAPKANMAGMQSMSSSSTSNSTSPKSSLGASMPSLSAPALIQQSAMQFAQDTINSTGKQMLGALPKIAELKAWLASQKHAEFNILMTPDPSVKPDNVPKADNGRRFYGTQFDDPTRPSRDVSQAFNSLNISKPTDVLNEMGQAEFGAPRA